MEIIFQGRQDSDEALESISSIIQLFKDRYQIGHFREMHLSVTLVDDEGEDVELIDSETDKAYRTFEVLPKTQKMIRGKGRPMLKLVIDNSAKGQ